MSKTGTTSLTVALVQLGLAAVHYPSDQKTVQQLWRGNYDLDVLTENDGAVESIAPFYAQLDAAYPGSKFVLTVREKDDWLRSMRKWWTAYPVAKDRDVLLTFYDFPAEHWIHLRTTNPIESTFAAVRHRHRKTKVSGTRIACLAMVFKLKESAAKKWQLLNGSQIIPEVLQGIKFIDGIREEKVAA
jgi:hypothetical protein